MKARSKDKKINSGANKSKVGQIRMISESNKNSKTISLNSKAPLKRQNKSKASFGSKTSKANTKKLNLDANSLKETSNRPAININFKEVQKDISKEIP